MYSNEQYSNYQNHYNHYATNNQYYNVPEQHNATNQVSPTNAININDSYSSSYIPTYSPLKYSDTDSSISSASDNSYSAYSSFDYSNWYKPYQQNYSYIQSSSSPKYQQTNQYNSYSSNSISYNQDTHNDSYQSAQYQPEIYRPISPVDFQTQSSHLEQQLPFTNTKTSQSKSTKVKKSARVKKLLSDDAVEIMNDWFDDHVNNPYPTQEEKERMAYNGNITVKQVTAWFSNRRNRSQNTKPKRMKRVLEKEISSIFNQISDAQPDKFVMMERLKSTISSRF